MLAVAGIHAVIGYALAVGTQFHSPWRPADDPMALILVELTPLREAEPVPPPKPRETVKRGGTTSAPEARLSPAIDVPIPVLPVPSALIIDAPPMSTGGGFDGNDTAGIGAGGGSGEAGPGSGDGSGDGDGFTGARQIRGSFRNSDFPASARDAGRLRIGVRYAVGPAGRVEQCEIIEPSGYPEVDAMTCRVIVDRYRFKPARDEEGAPITEVMEENYTWVLD